MTRPFAACCGVGDVDLACSASTSEGAMQRSLVRIKDREVRTLVAMPGIGVASCEGYACRGYRCALRCGTSQEMHERSVSTVNHRGERCGRGMDATNRCSNAETSEPAGTRRLRTTMLGQPLPQVGRSIAHHLGSKTPAV